MPELTPGQIAQISGFVAQYITAQREKFLPLTQPLGSYHRAAIKGFFLPKLLDSVRVLVLGGVRVENPHFYPMLAQMGFTNVPDFAAMAAITFSEVIVSRQEVTLGLLFHELVHVEQYRQLGIPRFADLYVRGFLTGGGYSGIPLEINANTLGARYEQTPNVRFSVEDEVRRWLIEGRF
jgi:hypothetical protein